MKNTNYKTKKFFLLLLILVTLSSSMFARNSSITSKETTLSLQSIESKELLQTVTLTDPKSSMISMKITKTADILDANAENVMVVGSIAYVANGFGGLNIINITDPTTPVVIGQLDDGGEARSIYVSGSYACVTKSHTGI